MRILSFSSALLCLALCAACHNSSGPSEAVGPSEADNFFVQGDPRLNIKDTELNSKSFFTVDQMNRFDGFEISASAMSERVPRKQRTATVEEAKKQQREQVKAQHEHQPTFYKMDKRTDANGKVYWFFHPQKELNYYNFYFYPSEKDPQQVELKGWSWKDGDPEEIDILHYSLKRDGSAFSILFYRTSEESKSFLVEFLFMKPDLQNQGSPLSAADSNYNYIHSSKIRVNWPQAEPVEFVLCGPIGHGFQGPVIDAFENWRTTLQGRLEISLGIARKRCPPFSDLNVHGIYFVDNYNADYGMATYIQGSAAAKKVFDADILVNIGAYKRHWMDMGLKPSDPRASESFYIYNDMTHELGHALGLDHKFESTSVMSYEPERRFSFYDRAAVQALYPLISELAQSRKPTTWKSRLKTWLDEKLQDSDEGH